MRRTISLLLLHIVALLLVPAIAAAAPSQANEQWTWIDGGSTGRQPGVYGVEDQPAPANMPSARGYGATWIDSSGDLWLFGGHDNQASWNFLNDLWRYDRFTVQDMLSCCGSLRLRWAPQIR